jgi:hypothetical protein
MKLREHPLMSYRGARSWPPVWLWVDGRENERLRGEVGILIDVRESKLGSDRLFMTIHYYESRYVGWLRFDNKNFCRHIFYLLKDYCGYSISHIGGLDIPHTLSAKPGVESAGSNH